MTSHVPDPLTPEERKLAARLARIGPHGEPSPTLDARILGAAQAAATRKPGRGRPSLWPAWAGIAATVALALGAVWQLRPVQEASVELEETASPVAVHPHSEAASNPPPAPGARAAKIAPPPSDVAAPPPQTPAPPASASIRPAPPVTAAARSRDLRPPTARASALAESAASDARLPGTATTSATVTVTDLPVASDSQLPPVDWIERILQRHDAGDLAGARASLALLQRDYPQLPLPDDVRAIASPPAR